MKKIQLLLIGFLGFSIAASAQQVDIQKQINNQYLDLSHKAFIYQVSPQTKKADLLLLNAGVQEKRNFMKEFNQLRKKGVFLNNPDTSWRFEEYKAPNDSMYRPSSLGWRWTEGLIEAMRPTIGTRIVWRYFQKGSCIVRLMIRVMTQPKHSTLIMGAEHHTMV